MPNFVHIGERCDKRNILIWSNYDQSTYSGVDSEGLVGIPVSIVVTLIIDINLMHI